jgi:hypothetical protein
VLNYRVALAIQIDQACQTTLSFSGAGAIFMDIAKRFLCDISESYALFTIKNTTGPTTNTFLSQHGLATGTDAGYSQRAPCQLRSVSAPLRHVTHK